LDFRARFALNLETGDYSPVRVIMPDLNFIVSLGAPEIKRNKIKLAPAELSTGRLLIEL